MAKSTTRRATSGGGGNEVDDATVDPEFDAVHGWKLKSLLPASDPALSDTANDGDAL